MVEEKFFLDPEKNKAYKLGRIDERLTRAEQDFDKTMGKVDNQIQIDYILIAGAAVALIITIFLTNL